MNLSGVDALKGQTIESMLLSIYSYEHPEISQLSEATINDLSITVLANELFECFEIFVDTIGITILRNLKELILAEKIRFSKILRIDSFEFLEVLINYDKKAAYADELLFSFLSHFELYNKRLVDMLVLFDLEVLKETTISQKVVSNESYLGVFDDYNLPIDDLHHIPASSNKEIDSSHGITKKQYYVTGKHDDSWRMYFDGTQTGLLQVLSSVNPQLQMYYRMKDEVN